ncbi:porin family protein [Flavobacterium sediminilitoris]|uniref:Porin family protein n=1 Tax=Flavobacterium sediminilitoris TaxID=2024526 RepID=A0ABY4HHM2_9FLAO|nr:MULTISPECIES: outer membrane beta-barrel protein [Flavobacterium]UOX32337.1 porin family protein [Flavobacterium sediminilitoris]
MKKVLFAAVAVFAFSFANAQEDETTNGGFSQGDLFVSGGVGFNSTKQGDAKSNEFTFSPSIGYFVTENIAAGVRLNIVSGENEVETKNTEFGADIFGRYYFTPASKFSLFGELAVGFGTEKQETVANVETKYNNFGVNAGVGVNYFLSNNFAIEAKWAGLGYNSRKLDADGADARNSFGLNVDLSTIIFGLTYKF